MRKQTATLALIANLCLLATGSTAVLVTYDTVAPTENLALSNPLAQVTSLSARWTTAGDRRDAGQTFSVGESFSLSQIVLYTPGASSTSVERNFTLIIESFATSSVTSTRTEISAQQGVLPSLSTGNRYVTFTLDTPVSISASTIYGFRFSFDTEHASSSIAYAFNAQTSYPGGTGYQINYSTSTTPSALGNDMAFYLVAAPVPEPSTLAMLGIGTLGLLRLIRRRNIS